MKIRYAILKTLGIEPRGTTVPTRKLVSQWLETGGLTGTQFTPAERGRTAVVYFFIDPEGRHKVAKFWSYRPGAREAVNYLAGAELLNSAGVPIPPVTHVDGDPAICAKRGFEFIVEDAINGHTPGPDEVWQPNTIEKIATGLAAIHAVEGPDWGRPWAGVVRSDPRREFITRMKKAKSEIKSASQVDGSSWLHLADQVMDVLSSAPISKPKLTHGDPHRANLILAEDDTLYWIDPATVRFDMPEADLAQIKRRLRSDQLFRDKFIPPYVEASGVDWADLEQTVAALETWYAIEKVRKGTRLLERKGPTRRYQLETELKRALEFLEARSAGT